MMKRPMIAVLAALVLIAASVATPALAADEGGSKDAGKEGKDDFSKLPPFPADKSVRQTTTVDGRSLTTSNPGTDGIPGCTVATRKSNGPGAWASRLQK